MSALDRLFAGWRSAYVGAAGGAREPDGCVFCHLLVDEISGGAEAGAELDADRLVLARHDSAVALLNAYPYASGHLMVLPVRHLGNLEDLEPQEATDLWALVRRSVVAVKAAYQPDGVNLGCNLGRAAGAGVPGHLHVHVVPRWVGDANFMTTLASARVLPESLPDSWKRLRKAF